MLITQWLAHCALAFATTTFSQHIQSPLNLGLEQPVGLNDFELSKNALFSLHKTLVNIESISGNEQAVGEFLESYLRSHNYTVERQNVDPLPTGLQHSQAGELRRHKQRFNLLAYPGENRQTPVLLSSHIDTVPPHYGYEIHRHDQIFGRGSVDAKGSISAQIYATQELLASGEISANDVSLLFVVGEETGGDGMRKVNDLEMEWQTVIFGEPTELKLATGHKGIMILTIKAHGKAGHSGYPWLGQNANHMLMPALITLQKLALPSSEKYGNSTLNIGHMSGGVAANVIAEEAYARIGIRIAAGCPETVKKLVSDAVKAVDEDLELDFSDGSYGPVYIDSDVEGFETVSVNYGTDIPNLKGKHKRYLYGPGSILVAHSDHEHLKASHLLTAVDGYKRLVRSALRS
ncbi:hypothetical protein HO133_008729 [Letharia lupina]|uniref:Peptidase M20 dimerisation domain-containing protein n=1 Tax=Letharia lupina TaxID=560253 RepID=A0A8H6FGI2_9LECA|nr:uncharacterized protein HO133_008729 [Letharia lupina]KAF6227286.1 hypothetical protein HO133_008729 [Letharia lupina]